MDKSGHHIFSESADISEHLDIRTVAVSPIIPEQQRFEEDGYKSDVLRKGPSKSQNTFFNILLSNGAVTSLYLCM